MGSFEGVQVLDLIGELQLEKMGVYELNVFIRDCQIRSFRVPQEEIGCWLTEVYLELARQAQDLLLQKERANDV